MDLRAILHFTSFLSLIIIPSSATISKGSPKVIDARGQGVRRGFYKDLVFANFKAHNFSDLNITSLGTDYVLNGSGCGFACVTLPSCFSSNLAAFLDISGRILCELLPSDKYNNSNKLAASKVFHHFSIWSPCISGPCQNRGACVPLYEKNSYVCLCMKGYKGGNCEIYIPINSTIISDNGYYLSKLEEFLAPAVGNDPQWMLCYRASSHGWLYNTEFHSRCNGKNHTVTIIKRGQYVFGGYTDIAWESPEFHGRFGSTPNAFIFSLRNKEDLGPFKSVVPAPGESAIFLDARYGPTFGTGWDLYIAPNSKSNNGSYTKFGSYYPAPSEVQDPFTILAGTQYFSPDDWEVFYLG